ncbi:MAG: hotdog domain-containing protein [Bacteroidales bacterium]
MEYRIVEPVQVNTTRLVKSEDLNHHGTLFAGRTAEWFVESGFIAAASLLNPQNIVCLKIHGLYFSKPVRPGQILKFVSKVVYAGKSSLVSYIHVTNDGNTEPYVSGFITFIHVNEKTVASPHFIQVVPKTDCDKALFEQAKSLKKK